MSYQDNKTNLSFLNKLYRNFGITYAPIVGKYFDSKTLTMLTLLWSILIIFFGYLARSNKIYIWAIIFFIFIHQLTDSLDGAVGRYNKEGFIKWGYFMDHLLDISFAFSVFIALMIIFYNRNTNIFICIVFLMVFVIINMIASVLLTCENEEMDMSVCLINYCFSTDEMRVILSIILIFIFLGYKNIYYYTIIAVTIISLFATIINIYIKQKKESDNDILVKNKKYKILNNF